MTENEEKQLCGIVMPISATDGCPEGHWSDILDILTEAIEDAGFSGNLVSNADDVGIIQKRIIQNLYDNPIIVCDVSGKSPNVMFELGLRLAFDKPTIIIKDDKTSYSFDTSPIEHIEYPRDLRFTKIIEFKEKLTEKIKATHKKSLSDPSYTTFLKHFGEFKIAKLDKKEVSGQEFILEELKSLISSMRRLERNQSMRDRNANIHFRGEYQHDGDINVCLRRKPSSDIEKTMKLASDHPDISDCFLDKRGTGHYHLIANVRNGADVSELERFIESEVQRKRLSRKKKAD